MPNLILTFLIGGALCALAQILIDLTKLTPARILVCYVSLGVLLYAVGVYDPLFSLAGCGVSTPLIGFGAAIGRGVKESISENGIMGILEGGLSATAAGITASVVIALILSFFFKGKSKRL
jgi:stage V sporulation protein AE